MNEMPEFEQDIGAAWSSIRGILRQHSFAAIKDLVGAAGLPVERLSHLQQSYSGGTSKGQLMDAIDALVLELAPDRRSRFVIGCIEDMVQLNAANEEPLRRALARVGFGITGNTLYPLALQMDIEMGEMPEEVRASISKALLRYRDGDFTGAITGICGGIDKLTEALFAKHGLGNSSDTPFQERVSRAFRTLETAYCASLAGTGVADDQVKLVWENHKKAISNSAYVLGAFRRQYSDAHGEQSAPAAFVQKALDCGVFIIRSSLAGQTGAAI